MRPAKRGIAFATVVGTAALVLSLAMARADEAKTYVMKLGTATMNRNTSHGLPAKAGSLPATSPGF